jgi:hypothetical protein
VVALRDAIEKYETRGGTPLWQLAEHFGINYEKRSICVRGEPFGPINEDAYLTVDAAIDPIG